MALKRFVTSTAVAAALVLPGVAAFAQDAFYIVQDVKTKKCAIVDKKPVTAEAMIVGPQGTIYKTRAEAEGAMKTAKVCTVS